MARKIRKDRDKDWNAKAKYCPHCKRTLPATDFYRASELAVRKRLAQWCKACKKQHQKEYSQTPEAKDRYLQRTYGISLDTYNQMLQKQGGQCAICGCSESESNWGRLVVDHCHKTGQVRGLLCSHCNMTLGSYEDNTYKSSKIFNFIWSYMMAKKRPKRWVQAADIEEGALTRKAQAKGMSISEFCGQPNLSSKSKKQCNLAKTFRKMSKRNK